VVDIPLETRPQKLASNILLDPLCLISEVRAEKVSLLSRLDLVHFCFVFAPGHVLIKTQSDELTLVGTVKSSAEEWSGIAGLINEPDQNFHPCFFSRECLFSGAGRY
jgi:hypothetical protein